MVVNNSLRRSSLIKPEVQFLNIDRHLVCYLNFNKGGGGAHKDAHSDPPVHIDINL